MPMTTPARSMDAAPTQREPLRTCAGCRKVDAQRNLVRAVADQAGRLSLQTGRQRAPGRGTYVHRDTGCIRAALRGGFARSLRRRVSELKEADVLHAALESSLARAASVKDQEDHS